MAVDHALCPRFHKAIELIGARWSGAVIQLLLSGKARFTDLRLAIPDLSDRMLSERLRELEAEGIVERTVIPDVPVRIEYGLTEKGRALQSSLDALAKWAERWVSKEEVAAANREQAHGRRTDSRAHPATARTRRRAKHSSLDSSR